MVQLLNLVSSGAVLTLTSVFAPSPVALAEEKTWVRARAVEEAPVEAAGAIESPLTLNKFTTANTF